MKDIIYRDDAIKALRKLGHEVVVIDKVCSLGVAQEFIDVIRELPSADRPQEWIPCSERLPNEREWIRSYVRSKRASEFIVMIKGANRPTTLYLSKDHYWFDDNNDFYEVVAWMPLPDTRSGQDNENA